MRIIRFIAPILFFLVTGCSTVAPQYNASIPGTQSLRNSGTSQVAVEEFKAGSDKVNHLSIRGAGLTAPTGGSYAMYLQKALEQELYDANRLNNNADVVIGGTLINNVINASGISVGTASMEAEFTVRDAQSVRYRKTHKADIEWPSSFVGSIAIPRAITEYPRVVQELLARLYADPAFQEAIK